MKSDDILPRPEEVKMPSEELELMAKLTDTSYFVVLKRWARRYSEKLKNIAFHLNPTDENFLVRHTQLFEQANGMDILISAIENSSKKLDEEEQEEKEISV